MREGWQTSLLRLKETICPEKVKADIYYGGFYHKQKANTNYLFLGDSSPFTWQSFTMHDFIPLLINAHYLFRKNTQMNPPSGEYANNTPFSGLLLRAVEFLDLRLFKHLGYSF